MMICGCGSQRWCAIGVNQHHFSEMGGGPKACQRCNVLILLRLKELERGLRTSGSVHSFFSMMTVGSLNSTKQGEEEHRTRFNNVCSGSASRVYGPGGIKVVSFIRCWKWNTGEMTLEMSFSTLALSWQGPKLFKTGGTCWSKNTEHKKGMFLQGWRSKPQHWATRRIRLKTRRRVQMSFTKGVKWKAGRCRSGQPQKDKDHAPRPFSEHPVEVLLLCFLL